MAKKSEVAIKPLKLVPPAPQLPKAPALEAQVQYSFPSKSRCPRCKGTDTVSYKTNGNRQYRKCRAPVCRARYSEEGQVV